MRQKEKNIKAEVKAGVTKSSLPVGISLAADDPLEAARASQSNMNQSSPANYDTQIIKASTELRKSETDQMKINEEQSAQNQESVDMVKMSQN